MRRGQDKTEGASLGPTLSHFARIELNWSQASVSGSLRCIAVNDGMETQRLNRGLAAENALWADMVQHCNAMSGILIHIVGKI